MQTFMAIACAAVIFGLAIAAMAVGLMLRGKIMRGGCGGHSGEGEGAVGCDVCSKKQLNICDTEDTAGLAGPSMAATMGRFRRKQEPERSPESHPKSS